MALGVPLLEHFPLDLVSSLRYKTVQQSDPVGCQLETSWNRCLSLPTPSGRFPLRHRTGRRPRLAVQAYVHTLRDEVAQLHDRVETLEARLTQNSTTSSRPPSSDAPYKKPRRLATPPTPRKAGGKPGHPGHRQVLLPPTTVRSCGLSSVRVATRRLP